MERERYSLRLMRDIRLTTYTGRRYLHWIREDRHGDFFQTRTQDSDGRQGRSSLANPVVLMNSERLLAGHQDSEISKVTLIRSSYY